MKINFLLLSALTFSFALSSTRAAEHIHSPAAELPPAPLAKSSLYQIYAKFTDDTGRAVSLLELRGRPVVLAMFFTSCSYACPLIVTDMQALRAKLPDNVRARTAFVLVSFDVARDTPPELARYRLGRALDSQWTLLHGGEDAVREIAAVLGVSYKREIDGGFAHSNVITLLNREGEIVHQRPGLTGGLDEAAKALTAAVSPSADSKTPSR